MRRQPRSCGPKTRFELLVVWDLAVFGNARIARCGGSRARLLVLGLDLQEPNEVARSQARAQRVVHAYLILGALALVSMPALSFLGREPSAFRNVQIALNGLLLIGLLWSRALGIPFDTLRLSRPVLAIAGGAFAVWLMAHQLFAYFAFATPGADFSIFDWMLHNTTHGRFMYSPVYAVNHLGVHQHWLLFALVPFHWVAGSQYFLLLLGPLVVASAVFPLWKLGKHLTGSDGWTTLLVAAYATCSRTGELLASGFRPEVFFPLFGFALVLGWLKQQPKVWLPALLLFVAIREDAPLYASGLALSAFAFEPRRRKEAAALLGLCVAVFAVDLLWARPAFLSSAGPAEPQYMSAWSRYGSTTSEVIRNMAASPLRVAGEVLSARWYSLFGAALFLPLLSPRALVAMAPALLVFGTSAGLRPYRGYSIAAILPFLFWGLLDVGRRLERWPRVRGPLLAACLLLFPLVGAGYLRFERPDFEALRAWPAVEEQLGSGQRVCAQLSLFPHLPYRVDPQPFVPECLEDPAGVTVINLRLDPWPYTASGLAETIGRGPSEPLGAGFLLIRGGATRP